jgi:hypothetical protein
MLVMAAFAFFGTLQFGGVYHASEVEWTAPPAAAVLP